jgi:predicted outer membrane repeat protein
LLWLWLGSRAQAADLTVTSTADSGAGSLRQALADAMNGDTITFASALSGATITLSSAPLTVNKTVSINGAALPLALTLSGNNAKALFSVGSSGVLTLTRLTLANGNGNYGGALYNGGTLTLDRVTLTNNNALSGGAIYTVGTLTIRNSTLNGNRAFSGGAIDNYGALTIHNSTLSGNHGNNTGGGLFNAGTLYLYNALLADSSSGGDCLNANDPFFGLVGVIAANVRTLTEDGSCGAALSGDPKLAALALSNGALVHKLAADSPALDAGDSATCLTVDQRGNARPQGAGCDLGAVETEVAVDVTNRVAQTTFSALYSAIPQPCATVAAPGLPRHTIAPTLQNNATSAYRDLYFVVTELRYTTAQGDNTPTLCNADGGAGGTAGARLTMAQSGTLADNRLAPGESFAQPLQVGLPVRARYRIFVNLYGFPTTSALATDSADRTAANLISILGWEFDENGNLIANSRQIFLPLTVR